jgi:hypothetical protein
MNVNDKVWDKLRDPTLDQTVPQSGYPSCPARRTPVHTCPPPAASVSAAAAPESHHPSGAAVQRLCLRAGTAHPLSCETCRTEPSAG